MLVPPGCPLSPRQFEVLDLVSQGLTRSEIAKRLGIAPSTVRTHLHEAYRLLDVHSAASAIVRLGRSGWHSWQPPFPRPEPLEQAVHDHFHRWVTSGFSDQQARDAWHIAYRALRVSRGLPAERAPVSPTGYRPHKWMQWLLHTVAADTLEPTQR